MSPRVYDEARIRESKSREYQQPHFAEGSRSWQRAELDSLLWLWAADSETKVGGKAHILSLLSASGLSIMPQLSQDGQLNLLMSNYKGPCIL